MSDLAKLSAALAATAVIVLSASAAHATVAVSVPKPTININVPKPTVSVTPISSSVRPGTFAGKPATVQNTVSNWQGPAGAGTQSTSMIYQNGKVVGAISSISKYPATSAPGPTTNTSHPATSASHPANQPQTAKPAPPPAPAKPKITFTPVEYPAFTDQYGTVKGYYVNGKLVYGLAGPTGGTCVPTMGYQAAGGGSVSSNYTHGSVSVHAVQCYIKS
ncbi:hypothetical protein [Afipia sp. GAS231]|uniref:hypothetical protein n=1 Tax=Afipia sp. GAS231 TaxID=1882747 RepID=UPI0012FCBAE5|nr:hypothetical protein [Afipia sp. GAS231]